MPTLEPEPPDTRERRYAALWNDCAPGEKLLTKGEVAQLCRVEIRTVDRWVAAGRISGFRTPGGRLLFRKREVLMAVNVEASPVTRDDGNTGHETQRRPPNHRSESLPRPP
jgi:excisionase family DNA binding protein